jgi:DNA polymerase V
MVNGPALTTPGLLPRWLHDLEWSPARSFTRKGAVCFTPTLVGRTHQHRAMELSSAPAIVAAGFPSPAEEFRQPRLNVQQLLGIAEGGSFCERMTGSALSSAGIDHNDLLVISPSIEAVTNDLVVATVNGSRFIRRLVIHHDVTFLLPASPLPVNAGNAPPVGIIYPAIRVKAEDDFQIQGVVLGSFHAIDQDARRQALLHSRRVIDLNHLLGLDRPETYCTQVKGVSMQGAHIFDRDVLVVRRTQAAHEHDIIIASLQGGFVVKRLLQARETTFLQSDHPLIPPIAATTEAGFQVWGVVMFCLHPVHRLIKDRLLQQHKSQAR